MKGCPFTNPTLMQIAAAHNVSAAQVCLKQPATSLAVGGVVTCTLYLQSPWLLLQVCLRWVLERGCISATGSFSTIAPSTHGPCTHDLTICRHWL